MAYTRTTNYPAFNTAWGPDLEFELDRIEFELDAANNTLLEAPSSTLLDDVVQPATDAGTQLVIDADAQADAAETSAANAAASASLAEQWAENDRGVDVLPGQYSSKHWNQDYINHAVVFVNSATPDTTLPANPHNGAHRVFFKTAAGSMNVTGNGNLIEGSAAYSLEDGTSLFVFANGAWVVIRDGVADTPAGPFFKLLTFDSLSANESTEVAISGDTIVLSAITSAESRIYIYDKNPTGDDWPVTQVITSPESNRRFGEAISLDGDWLIVGDGRYTAYIYHRAGGPGGQWTFDDSMTTGTTTWNINVDIDMTPTPSAAAGSVAIGDWFLNGSTGQAIVHTYSGSGWSYQATITSPVGGFGHEFGREVILTGDELLVGAAVETSGVLRSGYVYAFDRSAGGTWTPSQEITDPADDYVGRFGKHLSRDGDWLAVGADRSGTTGHTRGVVYIYRKITGSWVLQQSFDGPEGVFSFGISVSMSNGTLLVGTTTNEAHAFTLSGSTWSFQRIITVPDEYDGNGFGREVATDDGTTSVFSAFVDDELAAETSAGYVGDWSDL